MASSRGPVRSNEGFSLVTVMAAMGLSSIVMLGVAQTGVLSAKIGNTSQRNVDVQGFQNLLRILAAKTNLCDANVANLATDRFNMNSIDSDPLTSDVQIDLNQLQYEDGSAIVPPAGLAFEQGIRPQLHIMSEINPGTDYLGKIVTRIERPDNTFGSAKRVELDVLLTTASVVGPQLRINGCSGNVGASPPPPPILGEAMQSVTFSQAALPTYALNLPDMTYVTPNLRERRFAEISYHVNTGCTPGGNNIECRLKFFLKVDGVVKKEVFVSNIKTGPSNLPGSARGNGVITWFGEIDPGVHTVSLDVGRTNFQPATGSHVKVFRGSSGKIVLR